MFASLAKIFSTKTLTNFLIPIFFSIIIAKVIIAFEPNYFLTWVVVLGPLAVIFLLNKPFLLLQILIFLIPFNNASLLDTQIMNIPGLKLINIVFILTIVSFILTNARINIQFFEKILIFGILFLLLIAVFRSMSHIQLFNFEWDTNLNKVRFFQSYFLKSVVYFSPFIFITLYVSDSNKVELLLKTFIQAIMVFSLVLLGIYAFFTPDKTNFEFIRKSFSSVLHLHGNNLATIYATSFPLLLSYHFIKRNWFSTMSIVLAVITIGLLYSRTAYLSVLISVFIYLYISKRFKIAPFVGGFLLIVALFLPSSISERATTGIQSKDVYSISAGRVEGIWAPLVEEVLRAPPEKLFFGTGLYAILFSESYEKGQIYRTGHAHNLYLNTTLDMGLVGLAFLIFIFAYLLKSFFKAVRGDSYSDDQKEVLYGVIVAILSFLVAGFTGRVFYPAISNYLLWIIIAIGFAITKVQAKKGRLDFE